MIVCICKGVPESKIQDVVERGARTVSDVGRACGAGTDCGSCTGAIEELITEGRIEETTRACASEYRGQLRVLRAPCSSSPRESSHEGQRSGR